jgi:hypothetical protein
LAERGLGEEAGEREEELGIDADELTDGGVALREQAGDAMGDTFERGAEPGGGLGEPAELGEAGWVVRGRVGGECGHGGGDAGFRFGKEGRLDAAGADGDGTDVQGPEFGAEAFGEADDGEFGGMIEDFPGQADVAADGADVDELGGAPGVLGGVAGEMGDEGLGEAVEAEKVDFEELAGVGFVGIFEGGDVVVPGVVDDGGEVFVGEAGDGGDVGGVGDVE